MDELKQKLASLKPGSIVLIRCIHSSFLDIEGWNESKLIEILATDSDDVVLNKFSSAIEGSKINHVFELGKDVAMHLKNNGGKSMIVIKNAQNLSNSAQISFQEGIDFINFQRMFHPEEWMNCGSMIFVDTGLVPESTDRYSDTFVNYHKPLYQRFDRTLIV